MIILTVDFKYNLYFNLSMIPTPCFFHINPNHLNVLAGQGESLDENVDWVHQLVSFYTSVA